MIELMALAAYCNERLDIGRFDDYCPNGLQVEGRGQVQRVISGVTASLALIEAAVALNADLLLVHHGYFWKTEPAPLVGMKGRRIRQLVRNGLSLLAYHLPLDAHPELGNNARLGVQLDIRDQRPVSADGLLWHGRLSPPMLPQDFGRHLAQRLDRVPLHIEAAPPLLERIAWCTGGAQGYIDQAADLQCDAFLSGEVSEPTVHTARERAIHYFAAGHHATERYGVQALGQELAQRFAIQHEFVDIDNPV